MKKISLADLLVSLENRGARIRDILAPLFSFIFLRCIIEGIFEKEHLFGFNPYPYRSFLIMFVHFPLFYVFLFLMLVLVFYAFYPKAGSEPFVVFKKVAGSIASMFWIILLPPVIDLIASGGKGYELSYIFRDADPLNLVSLLFNPNAGQYGVSIGMRIEIMLALILCFVWVYIKRKNILLSLLGMVLIYAFLLFAGLLPLIVSGVSGENFAAFYSSGGILYYDTQKFAALFFILLSILALICCLLFFRKDLRRILGFNIMNAVLLVSMFAGFFWGLKKFHTAVPDFWIASDYLAVAVLVISGFWALRAEPDRATAPMALAGLAGSLILSYYTFLAMGAVPILVMLGKKLSRPARALIMVPAIFFAFLAGLAVFTHERAFSSLTQGPRAGYLVQKTDWNNEEMVVRGIEEAVKNDDWHKCAVQFGGKPYFVSPPAVVYLKGIFNMRRGGFQAAAKYVDGAIDLGYKTDRVLLSRGDIYAAMHEYSKAIAVYRELLAGGSTYSGVYGSLASAYFSVQDYQNAIYHYKLAIEQDDRDPVLYNNLGVAYLKTGDHGNARKTFLQALELDPQMEQAKKNLELIAEEKKR